MAVECVALRIALHSVSRLYSYSIRVLFSNAIAIQIQYCMPYDKAYASLAHWIIRNMQIIAHL